MRNGVLVRLGLDEARIIDFADDLADVVRAKHSRGSLRAGDSGNDKILADRGNESTVKVKFANLRFRELQEYAFQKRRL